MQTPQSSLQKTRTIGNYIITKNLGEGTFGKVKLAIHSPTGQKVAIKILQKSKIVDVADVQRVTRQIHILKTIRHPNLIQLYEIIETPKQLFLIMEYVSEGELFQHIVKKKKLKQNEACQFFKQIIDGVQYLHELGIVHRDLKPQNLLIDFNQRLKIVDFGLSNTYKKKQLLKTACGSPCYAAPEMIAGKKYEGLPADIWSCGVILFAMICGYLPFEDPNTASLYKKITSGEYKIPKFVSPFARQFLQRLLTTDPDKRIKIGEIKRHAWFRQPVELSFNLTCGIKVGIDNIPVDHQILQQVLKHGGEKCTSQEMKKLIINNRHNHTVTFYYLLLKRNLRNGKFSIFDISSPNFDPNFLKRQTNLPQFVQEQRSNEDLEQIQLDRITTTSGNRNLRAFSKNSSTRGTNASESPDITVHNFHFNKSKDKKKNHIQNYDRENYNSEYSDNNLEKVPHQSSSNRRKIYFKAPTKNILNNSIDLKTINFANPEIKTQRLFEKSSKIPPKQEKVSTHILPLEDIDDKKDALKRFFHQERKNIYSIRQAVTLRTSTNNRRPIIRKNVEDQFSFRQSLQSRQAYGDQRYVSLDIGQRNSSERQKRKKDNQMNSLDFMNRTLITHKKNNAVKIFGDQTKNQSQKIKSIMNNTMTAGFSKTITPAFSKRKTTAWRNPRQIIKPYF